MDIHILIRGTAALVCFCAFLRAAIRGGDTVLPLICLAFTSFMTGLAIADIV